MRIAAPLPRFRSWKWMRQVRLVQRLQQLDRAVGAAVLDQDELDLAGVLHVEHPPDRAAARSTASL